jgi:chromosome segregation ATPase
MSELLDRLSSRIAPTETVREHLHQAVELIEKQQATLNPHWQNLEEQKTLVNQKQEEVNQLEQSYSDRQNSLKQAQDSLHQQTAQLKVNTASLAAKQENLRIVKEQLQSQDAIYQQINYLAINSGNVTPTQKVDVQALEKMPLDELQKIIQDLNDKLQIDSTFVHDQEQELSFKQQTIEELQQKINQASDQDLINLQMELSDEQDLYQMLNETLVGQRRNLVARQKLIQQHQNILLRRQGQPVNSTEEENSIDFSPLLSQIDTQRQKQSQELQQLEKDIEQMRSAIELDQGMIDNQAHDLEEKQQELKKIESDLVSLKTATAECLCRINLYQEALQPIQDAVDELKQKLQGIGESLAQVQEAGDYQLQTITELRQVINSLISQPELVAS